MVEDTPAGIDDTLAERVGAGVEGSLAHWFGEQRQGRDWEQRQSYKEDPSSPESRGWRVKQFEIPGEGSSRRPRSWERSPSWEAEPSVSVLSLPLRQSPQPRSLPQLLFRCALALLPLRCSHCRPFRVLAPHSSVGSNSALLRPAPTAVSASSSVCWWAGCVRAIEPACSRRRRAIRRGRGRLLLEREGLADWLYGVVQESYSLPPDEGEDEREQAPRRTRCDRNPSGQLPLPLPPSDPPGSPLSQLPPAHTPPTTATLAPTSRSSGRKRQPSARAKEGDSDEQEEVAGQSTPQREFPLWRCWGCCRATKPENCTDCTLHPPLPLPLAPSPFDQPLSLMTRLRSFALSPTHAVPTPNSFPPPSPPTPSTPSTPVEPNNNFEHGPSSTKLIQYLNRPNRSHSPLFPPLDASTTLIPPLRTPKWIQSSSSPPQQPQQPVVAALQLPPPLPPPSS